MRVESYTVAVTDAIMDDLRERIRHTRWPDGAPGEPWSQGTDLDYLRNLLAYWADGFDWRARERELNRYQHRTAEVDGVRISRAPPGQKRLRRATAAGGGPGPARSARRERGAGHVRPPIGLPGGSYNHAGGRSTHIWV
ncbi:epoxide hydrolase N-terminal domain-containing protein [Streptacidiphilus sp. EB103A]|uniref:epoxide hydrolase N-terminal domain-containing protein n=1 Tax=Streptacidiphilus sp. EB103A TaxID=3156275 RepID=UPI0035131B67